MKIVFFGTPEYVLPVLASLHKKFTTGPGKSPIVAVVTRRPQAVGRKQILTYSPVDTWAHGRGIPIYFDSRDLIKDTIEADLGVLAAYGKIIPPEVVTYFTHGILNIHPSHLPKFRGASPVQATIAEGEKEAGVSIIKLDNDMDHGPIVTQFKEAVEPADTTGTLRTRLFDRAADVLIELIEPYLAGKITLKPQDHPQATYTTLIKREHGFIPPEYFAATLQGASFKGAWKIPFIKDFSLLPSPYSLNNFIRAMDPWPGAWTNVQLQMPNAKCQIKRLKILKAHAESGKLILEIVQLEGKDPVAWEEFRRGYPKAAFLAKD